MANYNRNLGPCLVEFSSTDLGETFGGVIFRVTEETAPVVFDQLGTTPVDEIETGKMVEVEVPLTDTTLATLEALLSGASGSGTSVASGQLTVKQTAGQSKYDNAGLLKLTPVESNGVGATSGIIHVFKAAPIAQIEQTFDNSEQRVTKFLFKGFPDRSSGVAAYRMWGVDPA